MCWRYSILGLKIIAIGNRLMGDEGIAIKVAEVLDEELKLNNIEVIIGETDIDYCERQINDNDIVILLDATCFGIDPGSITVMPIQKGNLFFQHRFTQHDLNMPRIIELSQRDITAYIIGVEIETISFSENLSSTLSSKLEHICSNIKEQIYKLIEDSSQKELEA
jgi:hydrogenase maturation protease